MSVLTFKKLIGLIPNNPLNNTNKIKFVRHKENHKDYQEIVKDILGNSDHLENYQRHQDKPVFSGCDYIVSFIGLEGSKALFWNVFKILDSHQLEDGTYHYNMEKLNLFDELAYRIVIDWGKGALAWHQHYATTDKEVLEIYPKGYLGNFPGYDAVYLTYSELQLLVNNPDANRDWKNALSAVNGIYLIVDKNTQDQKQYIGSAYGSQGIWGRWCEYASNGHGDNVNLKTLCEKENYQTHFTFAILKTLPKNLSDREVISFENLYKKKLGSRVYGLNAN